MITVETTDTSVRVTIPKADVAPERLNSFLDWLRLETIVGRGNLGEKEADQMATEIKAAWWAANKDSVIEPGR
jgi:hypothetical protein